MAIYILIYLLVGIAAGLIAGLFGVGGGLIIVPILLWIFATLNYDPAWTTHLAVGTSLATIIVTSISSVWGHHRQNAVRWDIVRQMAAGLFVGALAGAQLAGKMSDVVLQACIGVFAIWVAWRMFRMRAASQSQPERKVSFIQNGIVSTIIGVASAIFGIGGGSLTVPYLTRLGVRMQNAVATSAACGLPIALAGSAGFVLAGRHVADLPPWTLGYVSVPAFVSISLTSVVFAQVGAKLAHGLPAPLLKKGFSFLLAVIGIDFLIKAGWKYYLSR